MLANNSWTIYNRTSGSIGTITFHNKCTPDPTNPGYQSCAVNFDRLLNGRHLKGVTEAFGLEQGTQLVMCYGHKYVEPFPYTACAVLRNTIVGPDHLEFLDQHGGIIHLMRNG